MQYWTGSAWQTISGASITGNNLWKKLNFASVTTSKIRVVVNAAAGGGETTRRGSTTSAPGTTDQCKVGSLRRIQC